MPSRNKSDNEIKAGQKESPETSNLVEGAMCPPGPKIRKFVLGELGAEDNELISQHIGSCQDCSETADAYKEMPHPPPLNLEKVYSQSHLGIVVERTTDETCRTLAPALAARLEKAGLRFQTELDNDDLYLVVRVDTSANAPSWDVIPRDENLYKLATDVLNNFMLNYQSVRIHVAITRGAFDALLPSAAVEEALEGAQKNMATRPPGVWRSQQLTGERDWAPLKVSRTPPKLVVEPVVVPSKMGRAYNQLRQGLKMEANAAPPVVKILLATMVITLLAMLLYWKF